MTPNIQIARKTIVPTSTQMKTKKRAKPKNKSLVSTEDNKENNVYDPLSMDHDLEAGVSLITSFIQKSRLAKQNMDLEDFEKKLVHDLRLEYTGHWYPERPEKGSAFRCLRINQNGSESLIQKSARLSGFEWVTNCLPKELTIWIDPGEVSYRIGEEGSICLHYNRKINNNKF